MNRLIINGKLMELSDQSVIGITLQANTIGDLNSRQGNYTNTFKLPLTINNRIALEFSDNCNSTSRLPYTKLTGTYEQRGVELISDGDGIISKADEDFIYITLSSGNSDFMEKIDNLIVGDLYKTDTVFNWDRDNIFNSRDKSKYFIYPIIDWRTDNNIQYSAGGLSYCNQMLPTCLISKMFDRLGDQTGFTFTGDYITSKEHLNMVLTPDTFELSEETLTGLSTKAYNPLAWVDHFYIPEDGGDVQGSFYPITTVFGTGFSSNRYKSTVDHVGKLRFIVDLRLNWFIDDSSQNYYQQKEFFVIARMYELGGGLIAEVQSDTFKIDLLQPETGIVFDFESDFMTMLLDTEYFVSLDFFAQAHTNCDSRIDIRGYSTQFIHTPASELIFGSPIHFPDMFRMPVKTVLKDILNLRGLIIQTNNYTKEIQVNAFQDLKDNISKALNWSDKVDVNSLDLSYNFGGYAQENYLKFKEHETVSKGLGDGTIYLDNLNIEPNKTVVQIAHPATEQGGRWLGRNIPRIEALDGSNVWQKPNYRILQLELQNTTDENYFIAGVFPELHSNINIPFCRFFGFDKLIPTNYDAIKDILTDPKFLKLNLKLTAVDIKNVDFSLPIYLHIPVLKIDDYFYLNKINNYKEGLTNCEFVRL